MKVRTTRRAVGTVLMISMVAATPVRAATPHASKADTLFDEAQKALADGLVHEACRLFSESYHLDPAPGALLNLAVCHEREGKVATALKEFQASERLSDAAKQKDRASYARKKAAELSAIVPYVKLELEEPELETTLVLDDEPMTKEEQRVLLPLDPGPHSIRVSAKARLDEVVAFDVLPRSKLVSVHVPKLKKDPAFEPPAPLVAQASLALDAARAHKSTFKRDASIALVSTAAAGILFGTYFGIRTISQSNESEAHCKGTYCDPEGVELRSSAKTNGVLSTIGFGIALAGGGALTYLLLKPSDTPKPQAISFRLTPMLSDTRAGAVIGATF